MGTLGLTVGDWVVLGVACLVLLIGDLRVNTLMQWYERKRPWVKTAVICVMGLIVLVFGMYGIGFEADAFIYGGF